MKKKIFLIAALCLMLFGLAACGQTDPADVDYNGHSYEELKTNCQGTVQTLTSLSEEDKEYYRTNGGEALANMINRWDEAVLEYGSFTGFGDFEITRSGKTLTAAQTVHMAQRDILFTCVYTYHSMELEDVTIDGIFTVGEKMSTALLNTIMGISIVFCVLIIICLLICCFNIFPYLEKKKAAKAAPKQDVVSQIETREEQQTEAADDGELVAVIAAAIAAAEGTSADGFVVRSIRRR